MAFSVQRGVMSGVAVLETTLVNTMSNVGSMANSVTGMATNAAASAGASMFAAVKVVFEAVVSLVAAQHASTVNIFNGYQMADLPFKDELDLQATVAVREYAALRLAAITPNKANTATKNNVAPTSIGNVMDRFRAVLENEQYMRYAKFGALGLLVLGAIIYLVRNRSIIGR